MCSNYEVLLNYCKLLTNLIMAIVSPKSENIIVKRGKEPALFRSIATPPQAAIPTITAISMPRVEYLSQSPSLLLLGSFIFASDLIKHSART